MVRQERIWLCPSSVSEPGAITRICLASSYQIELANTKLREVHVVRGRNPINNELGSPDAGLLQQALFGKGTLTLPRSIMPIIFTY